MYKSDRFAKAGGDVLGDIIFFGCIIGLGILSTKQITKIIVSSLARNYLKPKENNNYYSNDDFVE